MRQSSPTQKTGTANVVPSAARCASTARSASAGASSSRMAFTRMFVSSAIGIMRRACGSSVPSLQRSGLQSAGTGLRTVRPTGSGRSRSPRTRPLASGPRSPGPPPRRVVPVGALRVGPGAAPAAPVPRYARRASLSTARNGRPWSMASLRAVLKRPASRSTVVFTRAILPYIWLSSMTGLRSQPLRIDVAGASRAPGGAGRKTRVFSG